MTAQRHQQPGLEQHQPAVVGQPQVRQVGDAHPGVTEARDRHHDERDQRDRRVPLGDHVEVRDVLPGQSEERDQPADPDGDAGQMEDHRVDGDVVVAGLSGVPGVGLRRRARSNAPTSRIPAHPGRSTILAITAISAAMTATISAARTVSRIEMPPAPDRPTAIDRSAGPGCRTGSAGSARATRRTRRSRPATRLGPSGTPRRRAAPDGCGGTSTAAASSQPTVAAAAKSKIAFTAGNARSVNSPAEGSPGISVRDGTMAASAAATQAAIRPAAITTARDGPPVAGHRRLRSRSVLPRLGLTRRPEPAAGSTTAGAVGGWNGSLGVTIRSWDLASPCRRRPSTSRRARVSRYCPAPSGNGQATVSDGRTGPTSRTGPVGGAGHGGRRTSPPFSLRWPTQACRTSSAVHPIR